MKNQSNPHELTNVSYHINTGALKFEMVIDLKIKEGFTDFPRKKLDFIQK